VIVNSLGPGGRAITVEFFKGGAANLDSSREPFGDPPGLPAGSCQSPPSTCPPIHLSSMVYVCVVALGSQGVCPRVDRLIPRAGVALRKTGPLQEPASCLVIVIVPRLPSQPASGDARIRLIEWVCEAVEKVRGGKELSRPEAKCLRDLALSLMRSPSGDRLPPGAPTASEQASMLSNCYHRGGWKMHEQLSGKKWQTL
jgi:hypothetical protein